MSLGFTSLRADGPSELFYVDYHDTPKASMRVTGFQAQRHMPATIHTFSPNHDTGIVDEIRRTLNGEGDTCFLIAYTTEAEAFDLAAESRGKVYRIRWSELQGQDRWICAVPELLGDLRGARCPPALQEFRHSDVDYDPWYLILNEIRPAAILDWSHKTRAEPSPPGWRQCSAVNPRHNRPVQEFHRKNRGQGDYYACCDRHNYATHLRPEGRLDILG